MKIVIPGGSGQVGTVLACAFQADGHEVVVFSRGAKPGGGADPGSSQGWRSVGWDATTIGPWTAELESTDVVINFAGRNVNCRYNARNRRDILESRVWPAAAWDLCGRGRETTTGYTASSPRRPRSS